MKKRLWYKQPTEKYIEGLPVGNGRLAAMLLGTPEKLRLGLNHEWMWNGMNRDRDVENTAAHLGVVRELLLNGHFSEGTRLANDYYGGKGGVSGVKGRVDSYEPVGDLFVELQTGEVTDYSRSLDLSTGVAEAAFKAGCGEVSETVVVSAADELIVLRVHTEKPADLHAYLFRCADPNCDVSFSCENGAVRMAGQYRGGIRFVCELRTVTDGTVTAEKNGFRIADATQTLLMMNVGTDAEGEAPENELRFPEDAAWDTVLARHLPAFADLFGDAELELDLPESDKPTDERVADFREGRDPQIPQLYFEFGRYLMASGSSGKLPLNLQGKWNEEIAPPWNCDYHLDINLEMCYWMAETLGMRHASNTFFNLAERYIPHGMEAARKLYGCRGVYFCLQTDVWGRMTPESYGWAVWTGGAGWMVQHFYDHWLYTRDEAFLRDRCWPFLREAARFYADYIIERDGKPVIVPSQSPENTFVGCDEMPVSLCTNCAMDLQLAHAVLREAAEIAGIVGECTGEASAWDALEKALPWPGIDSHGRLIEFDCEREEAEPGHRHLSHLIGLHPLRLYAPGSEGWKACEKSLDARLACGGGHTGWSRSWTACMMARLGRSGEAWDHFIALIADFATVSLLDLHPPRIFQIDGNMGGTAAVCEMLMHSREDGLYLLPALPAQWKNGSVRRFRAMGDVTADFAWKDGKITSASLRCGERASGTLAVHIGGTVYPVTLKAGETVSIL